MLRITLFIPGHKPPHVTIATLVSGESKYKYFRGPAFSKEIGVSPLSRQCLKFPNDASNKTLSSFSINPNDDSSILTEGFKGDLLTPFPSTFTSKSSCSISDSVSKQYALLIKLFLHFHWTDKYEYH